MEKFEQTFQEWCTANKKLQRDSIEYITKVLNDTDNKRMELSDEDYNQVTAPYDGGRHPEFDSNCYSTVDAVYLKNDKIYLSLEEADCDFERFDAITLYDVAFAMASTIENK